jgi:hypothetical protein
MRFILLCVKVSNFCLRLSLFPTGKMKTISDVEFASYLLRAKQNLDTPGAQVDPLSQVVVVEKIDGKGVKRGRRNVAASTSNKVPRLGEDNADVVGDDGDDALEKVLPPPMKGGRSTRHRPSDTSKPAELQGEAIGSVAFEGKILSTTRLPLGARTLIPSPLWRRI